jgi:lipoate-protein ligase A
MAIDLALLDAAATRGQAVLRTYGWTRPTVSFGRNEPVRGVWDIAAIEAAGFEVVRRPTGGRALLHHHEVTYSVTMPWPADRAWREAYDAVNQRLLQALLTLGVPARLQAGDAAPTIAPDGPICFAAPSAGEIVVDAGKVAGSAVWRTSGGYLQHGSILLHDDQSQLSAYRLEATRIDRSFAAPVSHWLGHGDDAGQSSRVVAALHAAWACRTRDNDAVASSAIEERSLHESRVMLSSADWLWRR